MNSQSHGYNITIDINMPEKLDVLSCTQYSLKVTPLGSGSSNPRKSLLGIYAGRRGVYIIHSGTEILYVGSTVTSDTDFTYSERLRRHFTESSSLQKQDQGGSHVYQGLAKQELANEVNYIFFLDLDDIEQRFRTASMSITKERKALVMEQLLIEYLKPRLNKR